MKFQKKHRHPYYSDNELGLKILFRILSNHLVLTPGETNQRRGDRRHPPLLSIALRLFATIRSKRDRALPHRLPPRLPLGCVGKDKSFRAGGGLLTWTAPKSNGS